MIIIIASALYSRRGDERGIEMFINTKFFVPANNIHSDNI